MQVRTNTIYEINTKMQIGPLESMSADSLIQWLDEPVNDPLPINVAHESFLLMHPRIAYLKNLPINSVILDIGAGEGQLRNFRDWLGYKRLDLKFIGISLAHGKYTQSYEEFHLCNLDKGYPELKLKPTNAIVAQFIEHVADPLGFLNWLVGVLPPGGGAFIDWPSSHTIKLPNRRALKSVGFDVTTLNFFDDTTHKRAFEIPELSSIAESAGLHIKSAGYIDMPFLAESLKFHGLQNKDQYFLSMAIWLKTNFISYISVVK